MRQSAVINLILRRSIPLSLGKRHLPQLCLNHLFLRVTGFKVAKNSAPLNTAGEPRHVYPGVPGLPIREAAERKGKGRAQQGPQAGWQAYFAAAQPRPPTLLLPSGAGVSNAHRLSWGEEKGGCWTAWLPAESSLGFQAQPRAPCPRHHLSWHFRKGLLLPQVSSAHCSSSFSFCSHCLKAQGQI